MIVTFVRNGSFVAIWSKKPKINKIMQGVVNQYCEAILPIVVKNDDKSQFIDAVIDTGFSGFLTLPFKDNRF